MGNEASRCCCEQRNDQDEKIEGSLLQQQAVIPEVPPERRGCKCRLCISEHDDPCPPPGASATSAARRGGVEDPGQRNPVSTPASDVSTAASDVETTVVINKEEGKQLGIYIDYTDGRTLFIERIGDGLVNDWNRAQPSEAIAAGDRIVEVNGQRGKVMDIVNECNERQVLTMKVLRRAPEQAPPLLEMYR